uniref:Uncharacterized protein n=1 Tax=Daphnia magna TaxID=35525 RepID=A0A0P6HC48_9CRUS
MLRISRDAKRVQRTYLACQLGAFFFFPDMLLFCCEIHKKKRETEKRMFLLLALDGILFCTQPNLA